MEGDSPDSIASRLIGNGITPIQIKLSVPKDDGDFGAQLRKLGFGRPKIADLVMFSRQMYTITKSGIPLLRGVKGLAAALDYSPSERLPLLKQPTLVLRLKDEFWEQAPRIRGALANGSMLDLSDYGQGFLGAAPQRFASVAREFYDR